MAPLPHPLARRIAGFGMDTITLAGPLEALGSGRPVDMRNRQTIEDSAVVRPAPKARQQVQDMLRTRLKQAGIWSPGKNAHSWRRAYQAEFIKGGGSREYYRLIMGHFNKANMDDLYTNDRIEEIVAQARLYAPTRFLREEAVQGALDLDSDLRTVEMEEDDDEGEGMEER